MSFAAYWIPFVSLMLTCGAATAAPQGQPRISERLHASALHSFRLARFSEAYGRLIALADAGHPPAADLALWMYLNGPAVLGKDWDSTPEQLKAWASLAGKPEPAMLPSSYPQPPRLANRSAPQRGARAGAVVQLAGAPLPVAAGTSRSAGRP